MDSGVIEALPRVAYTFPRRDRPCDELSSIDWRQGHQMPEGSGTAVEAELAHARRELSEALARHAATSEVLRVISASRTDAQPVFEMIVRRAVALCGSLFANVFRFDGELLHFVAGHNVGPNYVELLRAKYPMRPDPSQVSGPRRAKTVPWPVDFSAISLILRVYAQGTSKLDPRTGK